MNPEVKQGTSTEDRRRARTRRTRMAAIAVALVATVHWCHPPTLDIKIWDRNNGGRTAAVVAE